MRREKGRIANLRRYDPEREQARLALLEHQCVLAHLEDRVAKLRSGEAYPAMDSTRRAREVEEFDGSIARHRAALDELASVVGDPADVVDKHGLLPRNRRHSTLYWYQDRRIAQVLDLREKLPALDTQMKATDDKGERSKLRSERAVMQWRLDRLLAVPRLESEDMCADCATPANMHGYSSPPFDGPCPAWPEWARG